MTDAFFHSDDHYERTTSQKPALELLQKMGYTYISPAECERQRGDFYGVLLTDILRAQLVRLNSYEYGDREYHFSPVNIDRAIEELDEPFADNLKKKWSNIRRLTSTDVRIRRIALDGTGIAHTRYAEPHIHDLCTADQIIIRNDL